MAEPIVRDLIKSILTNAEQGPCEYKKLTASEFVETFNFKYSPNPTGIALTRLGYASGWRDIGHGKGQRMTYLVPVPVEADAPTPLEEAAAQDKADPVPADHIVSSSGVNLRLEINTFMKLARCAEMIGESPEATLNSIVEATTKTILESMEQAAKNKLESICQAAGM